MDANAPVEQELRWRAPVVVMTVAIGAILGLILYNPDAGIFFGGLVSTLAMVVFIVQTLLAKGRTKLICLGVLCLFAFTSWQMLRHLETIRAEPRWLVGSRHWKEAVLDQPDITASGMKCLRWDKWGAIDTFTEVYLVYTPDDGLRKYSPSNLNGLPKEVWQVQRLERQWYSVTFYDDERWNGCAIS